MRRPAPLPDQLLRLALQQEGLLSTAQADAAGVGRHRRAALRRDGALVPVVRGVHDAAPALVRRHGAQVFGGARVVGPDLALAQAVCELSREHAVSVLDSAIRLGLVAPDLERVRALARGRRGAARLEAWWSLVDGRADSPLETRARLQCVDAGLAPHELQVPVLDVHGRVVARGDLGWWAPGGRLVVVEIDGAGPHSTPAALYRDRERQNAIVATGATLLRFTASDVAAGRIPAVLAPHLAGPHARRTPGSAALGPSEPAQPRARR